MHQELSKREKLSATWMVIWVLMAAVMLTAFNTFLFRFHWNSGVTDLMIILVSVGGIYWLIKKNLITYKYCIIDDDFIVHELIGSKEKRILNLNIHQIVSFGKTEEQVYETDCQGSFTSRHRLYNCTKSLNRHYIVYEEEGSRRMFTFQPSDTMVTLISEKLNKR